MHALKISLFFIFSLKFIYLKKIENVNIPSCTNGMCENVTNYDTYTAESTTVMEENNTLEDYYNYFEILTSEAEPSQKSFKNYNYTKNAAVHKIQSDICLCDLTTSLCDINCCCDNDCNEFHLSVFSHCNEYEAKVYDTRYCYKSNFIVRNNTQFIHDKIAENLFCIAYDNLPPKYSPQNTVTITDIKALKKEVNNLEKSKPKWKWGMNKSIPIINHNEPYRKGDLLWISQGKFLKPLEFLQTGFSGHCTLKKSVKYLEGWKESCFQSNLFKNNSHLFFDSYNSFTVLASPLMLNSSYFLTDKQACPKNVCLSLTNSYCFNSWNYCTRKEVRRGSCTNGICTNIVKSIRYLFRHNGTAGIVSVAAYFKLANVSSSFHQHVEISFEWSDSDIRNVFTRSGNPGYTFGKPIIVGTSRTNITAKKWITYIISEKGNRFLTLPYAKKNGECSEFSRYEILFGQNTKIRCSLNLKTNNFKSDFCKYIQNRTLKLLLKGIILNFTEMSSLNKSYVSKAGDIFSQHIANWTQIFIDKLPENSIKGYIYQDEIRCEGLVTSMKMDIVHSRVPNPEITDNHIILGIGITFSNGNIATWSKCVETNCSDLLKVDIMSFVSFHDASKPSKYHFAVGPNIDIRLPYDFFYPFVSRAVNFQSPFILLNVILVLHFIY